MRQNIPCNCPKHTICWGRTDDVVEANRPSVPEKEKREDRNLPALLMLYKLALDKKQLFRLLAQLLVHRSSSLATITHSEDNRGTTTHDITPGINCRNG